ncbi:unnamed protein product, partial [Meganyctiphanes norvegica]
MWRCGIIAGVTSLLWYTAPQLRSLHLIGTAAGLWLALGGHYTLWQVYATLPRDAKALYRFLTLIWHIKKAERNNSSVPKLFQARVQEHPSKIAFYFEDEKWTFQQVEDYSNQVANYFADQGIKHGDAVALFMENRVEYICTWLGLTKIGAIPALINYNLRLKPLHHCIVVAECKMIICGAEVYQALSDIKDDLGGMPIFISGASKDENMLTGCVDLDKALSISSTNVPCQLESVNFTDKMVYIYTSGTTGLPKAAVIKHSRYLFFCGGVYRMAGLSANEVIYDPLPLYHTAGGMLGVGQVLVFGATTAIRAKFSASNYWKDCQKYDATAAQYIGEICRYLLNTPPKPEESKHKVRLMFGNGLRPQIWEQFQKRFNIPMITEFYGSTEGNANIINMTGKVGAVGFVSVLFPWVYPCALIKIDKETGEPIRNDNGLCIRCKPGEPGEFIGMIVRRDPVRDFHGYADKSASKKKIVENVFKHGDSAFLSGDILVMDEEGYLYFKDRTGDTFRWRGENVSTTEVEGVVSQVAGHTDAVVYGVEVPGAEGRAGMAAILDPEDNLDLKLLHDGLTKALPSYARPLFIRIVKELDMTGTYKLKKVDLQKEGFSPSDVSDKMYYLDPKNGFVPLDNELHQRIVSGEARL